MKLFARILIGSVAGIAVVILFVVIFYLREKDKQFFFLDHTDAIITLLTLGVLVGVLVGFVWAISSMWRNKSVTMREAEWLESANPMRKLTEQDWRECADLTPMLEFLQGKASDRKLRLFACACCRRMWALLDDDRERILVNEGEMAVGIAKKEADWDRMAVELVEKCADGQVDYAELKALYPSADDKEDADCHGAGSDAAWTANASAYHARFLAMYFSPTSYLPGAKFRSASKLEHDREQSAQCLLLRDIFGNPFHPITLNPSWLTPKVVSLAQAIYDDRTFDQMHVLAVELEKTGCADREILGHLRGPGLHVRGCWVVDLVLGKG